MLLRQRVTTFLCFALLIGTATAASAATGVPEGYQLVYEQDFEEASATNDFRFTDPRAWRLAQHDGSGVLELYGLSGYEPLHQSPRNIAAINTARFGDFILEVDLLQTGRDYGHRDMCLFFGLVDPSHYYYSHIATKTDAHAHNLFIVNNKPRTKISTSTTSGADWGQKQWHSVRVERDARVGTIAVYYDDMTKPIMTADDKTFGNGQIGFGSFDDTGMIDNIKIWSNKTNRDFSPKLYAAKPIGQVEPVPNVDAEGFVSLFDGQTLDGWKVVNGKMKYRVEEGCVVGTCVPGESNGFLRTEKTFDNFVFTVEAKYDLFGNSGIQFRSNQQEGDGRVFGYQCEIDPSDRSYSAGIYDESRRGWLFPLFGPANKEARGAFKKDEWNTFVIKAQDRRLQTWLNGVPCSDYTDTDPDDFTPSGFIALQVHSGREGQIRWRNIQIKPLPAGELLP